MSCRFCGKQLLVAESLFCEHCGSELRESYVGRTGKKPSIAPLSDLDEYEISALCVSIGNRTYDVLNRYVSIHNDVFGRSRIRALFGKVDYGAHVQRLLALIGEVKKIASVAGDLDRLIDGVPPYAEFLKALKGHASGGRCSIQSVMLQLLYICSKMFEKTEGRETYSRHEFWANRKAYELMIEGYTRNGKRLNALFADVSRQADIHDAEGGLARRFQLPSDVPAALRGTEADPWRKQRGFLSLPAPL